MPHLGAKFGDGELGVGVVAAANAGHGVGLVSRRGEIGGRRWALSDGRGFADGAVVELLPARQFADIMGIKKTDDEEERAVVFAGDKFTGEVGVVGVDVAGIEGLETVGRSGGFVVGEVPFAEVGSLVSGAGEVRAHGHELGGIEGDFRVVSHAGLMRQASGENRVASGHTQRVGRVGFGEIRAARGEAIEGGSLDVAITHTAAHGIGRLLVGHDEEDVGLSGRRGREHGCDGDGAKYKVFHGEASSWRGLTHAESSVRG